MALLRHFQLPANCTCHAIALILQVIKNLLSSSVSKRIKALHTYLAMRPSFLLPCVNRGCSTDIPVVGPAGLSRKKICSRKPATLTRRRLSHPNCCSSDLRRRQIKALSVDRQVRLCGLCVVLDGLLYGPSPDPLNFFLLYTCLINGYSSVADAVYTQPYPTCMIRCWQTC